ncbi:conserved hypothetical protein [Beggiatoa sp. PS]|nr:conserved hypothetical protein [Beggiatoa sp. PS]
MTKQQSSPFSTGSGGANFETRVQAAFTILMLSGRVAPCLPNSLITKLKLQGHYTGFETDDFIAFTENLKTGEKAKLFAQIKHKIGITEKNKIFSEVIQSFWNDFNNDMFDSLVDAFALITGPLSQTDIDHVRPILEWARHCENEVEFITKINTPKFGSKTKTEKLEIFKTHLKSANKGKDLSNKELWEFLKTFHLIGYDLDTEFGDTLSLLLSLISQYSPENANTLWKNISTFISNANLNAGTVSLKTLPEDIRTAFNTVMSSNWQLDVKKLKEHGDYILKGIRTTIGGFRVEQPNLITELLNLIESSNFIFVSGERGSGKSSLIRVLSNRLEEIVPVFCLRTEDLNEPHLDNVFAAIGLTGSLSDLETGFALMPKKYLMIESLEKLLELDNITAFRDLLQLINKQKNWTVIATGRNYAYQTITFNYLQPAGISFSTMMLYGFDDEQLQTLYDQSTVLQKISNNISLKQLLKSPFFADLAYRVLKTGTEFTSKDGENEFRLAVWRDVIAKEQERSNGMPLKRKQTFMDIAVKRAKKMVYGTPENEFDGDVLLKLEADNLIFRDPKKSLVSPAHDVLEDWAIEKYIENAYQEYSDNTQDFLDAIGNEPAINRGFRLWLHQKLREGENINDFVCAVLDDRNIQRYWQDEIITAVLLGENPKEFMDLLKNQLFLEDGELLKRFCFILRIACQVPNEKTASQSKEDNNELTSSLFLKPYGKGWEALIHFLLRNKETLPKPLSPHITAILIDWITLIHIDEPLPTPAHEVGLLALHLLNDIKDSYNRHSAHPMV